MGGIRIFYLHSVGTGIPRRIPSLPNGGRRSRFDIPFHPHHLACRAGKGRPFIFRRRNSISRQARFGASEPAIARMRCSYPCYLGDRTYPRHGSWGTVCHLHSKAVRSTEEKSFPIIFEQGEPRNSHSGGTSPICLWIWHGRKVLETSGKIKGILLYLAPDRGSLFKFLSPLSSIKQHHKWC